MGRPIPAYAHNDYENERPLYDALAMGYQGVEADYHLVRGELLVAHDLHQVRPGRTLQALYLEPLRKWVEQCGTVLRGNRPFLLNIEAKTEGIDAYWALVRVLSQYRDMITVVRDGVQHTGPVQVVLVGWYPPLDELAVEPERLVAVQWIVDDGSLYTPTVPAHLVRLVTLDYGKAIGWSGRGDPPRDAETSLTRLIQERDEVAGRMARVHAALVHPEVYRLILEAGVDLIGTKDLSATLKLLEDMQ